jgi:hypothetical protein
MTLIGENPAKQSEILPEECGEYTYGFEPADDHA